MTSPEAPDVPAVARPTRRVQPSSPADGFTTAFFIVLNVGADQTIRKEVAVRPAHATEFFGGVTVTRLVLALLAVRSAAREEARRLLARRLLA